MRPSLNSDSSLETRGGFTLIEVLAALLISAVALTYLIQSETASVRSSTLRDPSMPW